ncbi:uncharacterized protein LOC110844823 isoform X2 [Folsomia candida]|uniref:uncharacterized protein LOC110844823 isoform X2 n=1 Tax=Folsomia candida TaxID=158441 RepID=UPI000B8F9376|nr:uncharacterized protein LOC110844823 isoform X2 [Folsomia candida]
MRISTLIIYIFIFHNHGVSSIVAEEKISGYVLLAQTISHQFSEREQQIRNGNLLTKEDNEVNPYITVIPPNLPDPDCFGPGVIPINITIPNQSILGEVGVTSETRAYGFSKIRDELSFVALNGEFMVKWEINIPLIQLEGNYTMNLTVEELGKETSILGENLLTGSVDNVFFTLQGKSNIPTLHGKFIISDVDLDLGFSNFHLDGGNNATVGGVTIQWDTFSDNFQTYFNTFWNNETRAIINAMMVCDINKIIENCTVAHFIAGDFDCFHYGNQECYKINETIIEIGHIDKIKPLFETYVVCLEFRSTTPTSQMSSSTTPSTSTTDNSEGNQFQNSMKFVMPVLFVLFMVF